ncbi:MAG: response regulator [Bacteroidales bacterium]|nr:response regulator [Bacteroidales bacterium]
MNQEHSANQTEKRPLSILVVEDNLINQRLIMASLARIGHKVDSAADGLIAVDKFKVNTYDAILMDIMMPNMDGVTACKLIRELEKERIAAGARRIKIIAVTANAYDDDQDTFVEAGMDDIMNKPIDIEKLQQMLYA